MEQSYDQLISKFIDARVQSDNYIWTQAAIAFYLKENMKVPAKTIGSDTGYSSRYISDLLKTFSVFQDPDERAADQSFSIHLECARTDDPHKWLDTAISEGYSVRKLKRAIRGEKPEKDQLDIARALWDKVETIMEQGGEGADWLKLRITEAQLKNI